MQPRAQLAALRPRAVCSDVERRAAVLLHDDLRARGHEAWLETHWVRPQLAPAVALGCATAAAGGLIAIGAPALGLAVAALGALSLLADVAGATGPLRALLPRRASQVVLVAPAGGAVVDLLVAARTAGADGVLLGAAQLVPTVVLMLATAGALDAAAAPVADGSAEDEALAAALALHDALVRDPPPGIAAGLLLASPDALRAHLRRERLDRSRTALLHVRPGEVRSRHRQWLAAAAAAGLEARRRGPRGLPAALAAPQDAERLARALAVSSTN